MTRIDNLDLNLFDFDYDLTMMIFFLDADEKVYARYGGRDSKDADNRQSLAGLNYTMKSVLEMHGRAQKEYAPKAQEKPKYVQDIAGGRRFGGCMHCHQVREVMNLSLQRAGQWTREMYWRYPLPENVGITLEVDRGNVVRRVADKSPAAEVGLKPGDIVRRLGGVPIHSFGDAQFALDRAPLTGWLDITWQRGSETLQGKLSLTEGWRKGDFSWRASMRHKVASARLYGTDLTAEEKTILGLSPTQLAFRQTEPVSQQARIAGIRSGDIIIAIDGQSPDLTVADFLGYVQSNYLIGDRVTITVLREGKRQNLTMTLTR